MTTETLGTISSIIGILMFAWGIYKGYKELSLYGLMKKLADNKSTKLKRRILWLINFLLRFQGLGLKREYIKQ